MDTCAILCCGPSVEGQDLSKINVPIIGVNFSWRGRPGKYHVFTGMTIIDIVSKELRAGKLEDLIPETEKFYSGLPCGNATVPKRIGKINWAAYRGRVPLPRLPNDYDIDEHGWIFAGGGPCALQVAMSHKYKDIIFVGLDLDGSHFYGDDSIVRTPAVVQRSWIMQDYFFKYFKRELKRFNVRVRNTGRYDLFPRVDFNEVF
jgi:hypothetical protein